MTNQPNNQQQKGPRKAVRSRFSHRLRPRLPCGPCSADGRREHGHANALLFTSFTRTTGITTITTTTPIAGGVLTGAGCRKSPTKSRHCPGREHSCRGNRQDRPPPPAPPPPRRRCGMVRWCRRGRAESWRGGVLKGCGGDHGGGGEGDGIGRQRTIPERCGASVGSSADSSL